MFQRLFLVIFFGFLITGFSVNAFGDDSLNSNADLKTTTTASDSNELVGKSDTGPVTFDFVQKYSDWASDFTEVFQQINNVLSSNFSSIDNPDSLSTEIKTLNRLWKDKRNTPCMKLFVSSRLAICWSIIFEKYHSVKSKSNFSKWERTFVKKWDSIKNSTQNAVVEDAETLDCFFAQSDFDEKEKSLVEQYGRTPEGLKEGDIQEAWNNCCDAKCNLMFWKKKLAYQKRVEQAGGVVDLEVDRVIGSDIVQYEDELANAVAEYQKITHEEPALNKCQCQSQ